MRCGTYCTVALAANTNNSKLLLSALLQALLVQNPRALGKSTASGTGGRGSSSGASFTRALSPGSSGARANFPEAQPWSLATSTPDSVYSVLGDPPQTSGPPNSSPGTQLLAPSQECSEVAGWCYSAPYQPPKGKRHPPGSHSLVQALVVVVV